MFALLDHLCVYLAVCSFLNITTLSYMIPFKLVSALRLNVLTLSNMPVERWSVNADRLPFLTQVSKCSVFAVVEALLLCTFGMFLVRPMLSRGCFFN
jgi:hypothetical protein